MNEPSNQSNNLTTIITPLTTALPATERINLDLSNVQDYIANYLKYIDTTLNPMRDSLNELLASWNKSEYWEKLLPNDEKIVPSPVHRTNIRIKQPKSVVRKIIAKPTRFPGGFHTSDFSTLTDAVGVRVIVYFLSSLPLIDREIRSCGWFEVSEQHPPYAYLQSSTCRDLGLNIPCRSKPSGYNSIHYTLRLKNELHRGIENPWFELQLRTLTQDVWAEIEHLLGYKYRTDSSAVRSQLKLIGSLLGTIDENFDVMAKELSDNQHPGKVDESTPLTALNLPSILRDAGLPCSQYDLDGLLKMAFGCGIHTVRDIKQLLTTENIEDISAAAQQALRRTPSSAELVPLLLLSAQSTQVERQQLMKQIADIFTVHQSL